MKKFISVILIMSLIAGITGCSVPEEKTENKNSITESSAITKETEKAPDAKQEDVQNKIFRLSNTVGATSFDPSMGNSVIEAEVQYAINEGLVRCVNGEIRPGMAESWESDESGLIWTFHLRDDAKWSDGKKITAADYEYSWKRLADPDTGSGYAWILSFIENADAVMYEGMDKEQFGVKAVDENTLEVRLSYVAPYFLSIIGTSGVFAPLREDYVEKYGTDFASDASKNVYSGPFVLSDISENEYVFERNEYYWNKDAVNFDRAELYIIAEPETALALYENGDLDMVTLPTEEVANYMSDSRHGSFVNGNTDWLYINNEDPLLSNKNLRLALNYALNREDYNILANNSVHSVFNGVVCDAVSGLSGEKFSEEFKENRIYPEKGDIDLAKKYLEKAMEELNISEPSDIELEITTGDNKTNIFTCEVIQELLQTALGIKITIRPVTYSSIYSDVFPNHDYQLGFGGWSPDYDDPYTYLELFLSTNPNNYSAYKNDEVDELLKNARENPDTKERMENLGRAEKLILDDGALIPLRMRNEHYLIDEDLKDIYFTFGAINHVWIYGDEE